MLQRQHELGSPDVVSLREGLGTSDGPTKPMVRTMDNSRLNRDIHQHLQKSHDKWLHQLNPNVKSHQVDLQRKFHLNQTP